MNNTNGFIPRKKACFLWETQNKNVSYCKILCQPDQKDYLSKDQYQYAMDKFRNRIDYWICSAGCVYSYWDDLTDFESFINLQNKFLETLRKNEEFRIERKILKEFYYELGKIIEFELARKTLYLMFSDFYDPYHELCFEDFVDKVWCYDYASGSLL